MKAVSFLKSSLSQETADSGFLEENREEEKKKNTMMMMMMMIKKLTSQYKEPLVQRCAEP